VLLLGAAGAHIHGAEAGANGPVVAFLAQQVDGGRTEAEVGFSGSFDATGIVDDTCGATLGLLYATIIASRTYVNVHSTENPSGEVRGQILTGALAPTSAPGSATPQFKFRSAFVGLVVALVAVATM
jgi:hypothetical protein